MIASWLEERARGGGFSIGQVHVSSRLVLGHVDEAGATEVFFRPQAAREIAKYDNEGKYRPLKTAPNLRRGWELRLRDAAELRLALDFFYPAAIGTWLAHGRGEAIPTDFRETLARQTGMYRVTRRITDGQAEAVIRKRCSGCLRRQLWRISSGVPSPFTQETVTAAGPDVPILCLEACNLLVADCRPVAKGNLQSLGNG